MHGNSIRESRTPLTRSLLPYCRTRSLLPYCRSLLSYTSTVLETALASASLGGISTTSATSSKVSYASRSRSSQFTASALNKPSSSSSSSPSYFNASALKSLPPLPVSHLPPPPFPLPPPPQEMASARPRCRKVIDTWYRNHKPGKKSKDGE